MSEFESHDPESSLDAALLRAQRHAKNALAEGIEASRALLDAASLATSGVRAADHPTFRTADTWALQVAQRLASGSDAALTNAIADALDAEIERWEARAATDDEARAVLRAFLGVRELLWELGVRKERAAPKPERARKRAGRKVKRRAVERVEVEG